MVEEEKSLPNGLVYLENTGVVVGRTEDNKILTHVGPEHVLVMGPTRCGKGVNTVIPTALTWKGPAFFLDFKGEIWHLTSGYRKNVLGQEVIKIDPASIDEAHADEVIDEAIKAFCDSDREVSLYLSGSIKNILATKEVAMKFVDKLLQALLPSLYEEKRRRKSHTLLMLDEFTVLGYMKSLELALAIIAGNGVKMCLICQNVNQIHEAYGNDAGIMGNCHAHVYFTPGDGDTAKAIFKILGKQIINDETREVMSSDEVARMSNEKALLLISGEKPMMLDMFRYYMDKDLVGRVTDPPQE